MKIVVGVDGEGVVEMEWRERRRRSLLFVYLERRPAGGQRASLLARLIPRQVAGHVPGPRPAPCLATSEGSIGCRCLIYRGADYVCTLDDAFSVVAMNLAINIQSPMVAFAPHPSSARPVHFQSTRIRFP